MPRVLSILRWLPRSLAHDVSASFGLLVQGIVALNGEHGAHRIEWDGHSLSNLLRHVLDLKYFHPRGRQSLVNPTR